MALFYNLPCLCLARKQRNQFSEHHDSCNGIWWMAQCDLITIWLPFVPACRKWHGHVCTYYTITSCQRLAGHTVCLKQLEYKLCWSWAAVPMNMAVGHWYRQHVLDNMLRSHKSLHGTTTHFLSTHPQHAKRTTHLVWSDTDKGRVD